MARIAGINIPQNKLVHIGLTYIYGIGDKFSNEICSSLEIPKSLRFRDSEVFPSAFVSRSQIDDVSRPRRDVTL